MSPASGFMTSAKLAVSSHCLIVEHEARPGELAGLPNADALARVSGLSVLLPAKAWQSDRSTGCSFHHRPAFNRFIAPRYNLSASERT